MNCTLNHICVLKVTPFLSPKRIESASNVLKDRAKEFFFKENSKHPLLISIKTDFDIVGINQKCSKLPQRSKLPCFMESKSNIKHLHIQPFACQFSIFLIISQITFSPNLKLTNSSLHCNLFNALADISSYSFFHSFTHSLTHSFIHLVSQSPIGTFHFFIHSQITSI